jgi:hypothetical protein
MALRDCSRAVMEEQAQMEGSEAMVPIQPNPLPPKVISLVAEVEVEAIRREHLLIKPLETEETVKLKSTSNEKFHFYF